jgi:hypothetical protein
MCVAIQTAKSSPSSQLLSTKNDRNLELRNGNGNGLIVRVADANVDLLYANAGGFFLGVAV